MSSATPFNMKKLFDITPIPPVKDILSVDKPSFPVTNPTPDPINEYKLVLIAGANTDPPPSVPIPKSLIPLSILTAVPLLDPVIHLYVSGLIKSVSILLPR